MMLTDPIADMLTRMRNAIRIKAEKVDIPISKMKLEIAKILKEEGFIKAYKILKDRKQGILRVILKYVDNESVISGLKRISKPGRRVYVGRDEIPIVIPQGIDVLIADRVIKVKGPKGELNWVCPDRIKVSVGGGDISVERSVDSKVDRALHGLTRSIISNMVVGVLQGYQKVLEIVGVGYRAQLIGNKLIFTLGYSHPIEVQLPEGIKASVDPKQTQT